MARHRHRPELAEFDSYFVPGGVGAIVERDLVNHLKILCWPQSGTQDNSGRATCRFGCLSVLACLHAWPPAEAMKSKHPAKLEEPLAMSAIADASAEDQGSNRGLGQNAESKIIGELAGVGKAVHLAEFVAGDGINLLSCQWRQSQQIMQVSGPKKIELIAKKFVRAVRAEPVRAAEEELREPDAG